MELDEARADEAQTRLHRVGFGSFFFSQISMNAFHLLFLNPPYYTQDDVKFWIITESDRSATTVLLPSDY